MTDSRSSLRAAVALALVAPFGGAVFAAADLPGRDPVRPEAYYHYSLAQQLIMERDYLHALEQWDDDILFYPLSEAEVKTATASDKLAKAWQGEPLESKLKGPDDPRIAKWEAVA